MDWKKGVAGILVGTLGLVTIHKQSETILSSETDAVKAPRPIELREIFVHHMEDEPRERSGATNTYRGIVTVATTSAGAVSGDFIYKNY